MDGRTVMLALVNAVWEGAVADSVINQKATEPPISLSPMATLIVLPLVYNALPLSRSATEKLLTDGIMSSTNVTIG